jgi:hypothetical protein
LEADEMVRNLGAIRSLRARIFIITMFCFFFANGMLDNKVNTKQNNNSSSRVQKIKQKSQQIILMDFSETEMGGLDEVELIWFAVAFEILFELKFLVETDGGRRWRRLCSGGRVNGGGHGGRRGAIRRFDEIQLVGFAVVVVIMAVGFLVVQWRMRRRWRMWRRCGCRRGRRRGMSQTQRKIPVINILRFTVGREVDRHLIKT